MSLRTILVLVCISLTTTAAVAEAPPASPRPELRPDAVTRAVALALRAEHAPAMRAAAAAAKPSRIVLATSGAAVARSPRPEVRPQNLKREFVVRASGMRQALIAPDAAAGRGSVCGDPAIQGQRLSPIAGRLRGCGIPEPVRVTAVDGVALSQPATLTCGAAKALRAWVSGSVKPTVGRLGGGVSTLKVAAHYACRTRNNQKGAKISEHGRGRAIDVSAIILRNGVALSVLKGWRDKSQGKILRAIHEQACGTFGTVLGPNSDRFHQDHFHLDVARYRSGAYCR